MQQVLIYERKWSTATDIWKNFRSFHISLISTTCSPTENQTVYNVTPPTSYNEACLEWQSQKQNNFSWQHKFGLSLRKQYFLHISHMQNLVVQDLDSWRFTSPGLSVSQLHIHNILRLTIEMGTELILLEHNYSFHFQIS